jgi:hypothetical protein
MSRAAHTTPTQHRGKRIGKTTPSITNRRDQFWCRQRLSRRTNCFSYSLPVHSPVTPGGVHTGAQHRRARPLRLWVLSAELNNTVPCGTSTAATQHLGN